jgi:nicotinate-nucleotide adenylyltransferase
MQRIGIIGGTFDPIHYGHLAIAEEARWALDLTQVYFVPAAKQPLKAHNPVATSQQRLEMVHRACANHVAFVPSEIELRRKPPSFTIDTLLEMHQTFGAQTELWFILGGDALNEITQWAAVAQIVALAHLAAVIRPSFKVDLALLETKIPGLTARTKLLDGPSLVISSHDLRERLANNRPVRYQIPDLVLDYIVNQQIYLKKPQ